MFRRHLKFLILFKIIFTVSLSLALPQRPKISSSYDEYESFALVEVLLRDKKQDEVERALELLSVQEKKSPIYLRLKGQSNLLEGKKQEALSLFLKSKSQLNELDTHIRNFEHKTLIRLIAPLALELDKPNECLKALNGIDIQSEPELQNEPELQITRSRCFYQVHDWDGAYESLKSENNYFVVQEKVKLLLTMGLQNEAENFLVKIVSTENFLPNENLKLMEGLEKTALFRLQEILRQKFPNSEEVLLNWIQSAFENQMVLQSAEAFAQLSILDSKYYYQTAEFYRQIYKHRWSEYFGGFIVNPTEALKAKMALAIDQENYSWIAQLSESMKQMKLLEEDDYKYALAYAFVKSHESSRALDLLENMRQCSTKCLLLKKAASPLIVNRKLE